AKEIQLMLVDELWNCLNSIKSMKSKLDYYNEMLGDTSFLLAGLLGMLLKLRGDWDLKKWLDDSLIIGVKLNKSKLSIWGVMIWGMENTTEQWTDPFYFEIELGNEQPDFNEYTFMISDLDNPEIPYEEFRMNRNYWGQTERNWKYVINQKVNDVSK
ncbi:MAG: hypothetical protein AAF620_16565, partial [Bacteroidota bacterium]